VDAQGNTIGKVTSGTQSPTLKEAIGMAYVETAYTKPDTEVFVLIRDKPVKARVCKVPFLKK
jgi:aminomethyltransferase